MALAESMFPVSDRKPIVQCDECQHFRFGTEHTNNCSLGHSMQFQLPRTPACEPWEWGFHRPDCADRFTEAATQLPLEPQSSPSSPA